MNVFEAANKQPCETDKEFDTECNLVDLLSKKAADAAEEAEHAVKEPEHAVIQVCRAVNGYCKLAATLGNAENDLHHGLVNLHSPVESTAAVMRALLWYGRQHGERKDVLGCGPDDPGSRDNRVEDGQQ